MYSTFWEKKAVILAGTEGSADADAAPTLQGEIAAQQGA